MRRRQVYFSQYTNFAQDWYPNCRKNVQRHILKMKLPITSTRAMYHRLELRWNSKKERQGRTVTRVWHGEGRWGGHFLELPGVETAARAKDLQDLWMR